MRSIRKRLTYANVMSSIAVFLVVGGGAAFAATSLPKNSVGSPQIKKKAVKTSDIAIKAVRTGRLAPEAAKAGKIAKNAITTNRLRNSAVSTDKIGDQAVTGSKLGADAVTTDKIAANSVTREDIAGAKFIPRAYAYVASDGKVDPAFTDGIPDATKPATGVYCFNLGFTPIHGQATAEADSESNDVVSLDVNGANGAPLAVCPAGNDLEVVVWDIGIENETNEAFFLVVW